MKLMTITWQDATTAGIVLVTLGYFACRMVRLVRRKRLPGCGCCPKCPAETPEKPLVVIDREHDA